MMRRDELFARACAALQTSPRLAVRLGKLYPGDDEGDLGPGAAWLKDRKKPGLAAAELAEALQADARRNRAASVIGPRRKKEKMTLAERRRAENALAILCAAADPDPLSLLEALEAASSATQTEIAIAGSAALLDSICYASGTELAAAIGCTARRGQQIRAKQRAALLAGQQDLFAQDEI